MDVVFKTTRLAALEAGVDESRRLPKEVVLAYRKRILTMRAAVDERDLYQLPALRFKKLKG